MKSKVAKRLMSRKLDTMIAKHKAGIRALSRSEKKLITKCARVLLGS